MRSEELVKVALVADLLSRSTAGSFSLAAGFAKPAVLLFILRAFQGIGAACSIPPAIRLIVLLTPDPKKQGMALQL